jgi:hypothetical protein
MFFFCKRHKKMTYATLKEAQFRVLSDTQKLVDILISFLQEIGFDKKVKCLNNYIKSHRFLTKIVKKIFKKAFSSRMLKFRYTIFFINLFISDNNGQILHEVNLRLSQDGITVFNDNYTNEMLEKKFQRILKGNSVFPLYDQQKLVKSKAVSKDTTWNTTLEYSQVIFASRYTPGVFSTTVQTGSGGVLESTDILINGNGQNNLNITNWDVDTTTVGSQVFSSYTLNNVTLPTNENGDPYTALIFSFCQGGGPAVNAAINNGTITSGGGAGSSAYIQALLNYTFVYNKITYTLTTITVFAGTSLYPTIIDCFYIVSNSTDQARLFMKANLAAFQPEDNTGGRGGLYDIVPLTINNISIDVPLSEYLIINTNLVSNGADGGALGMNGLANASLTTSSGSGCSTVSPYPPAGTPPLVTGMQLSESIFTVYSQGSGVNSSATAMYNYGGGGASTGEPYTPTLHQNTLEGGQGFCEILCSMWSD